MTVISTSPGESFAQLLVSKFGPLWQQRQQGLVRDGLSFGVGEEWVIRVGEVKQGQGGVVLGRGAVIEIVHNGGGEEDDKEPNIVKAFWQALGLEGGREIIGKDGVEGWIEILRMKA